ncbi:signal peptidase I [Candidatus Woesebacteria bacterium]|nr:signal peptidase I [Candidatus Woesebacteria bacterium]QQG47144.1 MAG: signal peptidase I [Candidatus Woesebacteria bacterium]
MLVKRLGAFFLDILQVIVFAVSIFLFIYLLIMQPHKIKGSSMEPDFHDGEFLLTDKVTYRFGEPKRGDVVVFKAPPDDSDEFIKRIIGIPGDTIDIKGGKVILNGKEISEPYLTSDTFTSSGVFAKEDVPFTVPTDFYFVMGDNREHSFDGRSFGLINKSKITGRAWVIYWPVSKMGVIKNPLSS